MLVKIYNRNRADKIQMVQINKDRKGDKIKKFKMLKSGGL